MSSPHTSSKPNPSGASRVKDHQTPEDKTLADAEAVRHNSMQDGSLSVPRSEALNQRIKTSGDFCSKCKPNRKCNEHHDGFTIEPKEETFCLSDKIEQRFQRIRIEKSKLRVQDSGTGAYRKNVTMRELKEMENDVKEFVRRLNEFILQKGISVYEEGGEALSIVNSINRELKKLAGEKLI